MIKLLLPLFLLTAFTLRAEPSEERASKEEKSKYVGSQLKDLRFSDEEGKQNELPVLKNYSLIDRKFKWGATGIYTYYTLNTKSQTNGFRSEVVSDFSPGFNLFYERLTDSKINWGIKLQYQRVIFRSPNTNQLRTNALNLFDGGLYFTSSLASWIDMSAQIGYDTLFFLRSISNGVAGLKNIRSPYIQLTASPHFAIGELPSNYKAKLNLGIKHNISGSKENFERESFQSYQVGVGIEKKINATLYNFAIGYDLSNFKVNNLEQKSSGIKFTFAVTF